MVEDTIYARYVWEREDLLASLRVIFPNGGFLILVRIPLRIVGQVEKLTSRQESPERTNQWQLQVPAELTDVGGIFRSAQGMDTPIDRAVATGPQKFHPIKLQPPCKGARSCRKLAEFRNCRILMGQLHHRRNRVVE